MSSCDGVCSWEAATGRILHSMAVAESFVEASKEQPSAQAGAMQSPGRYTLSPKSAMVRRRSLWVSSSAAAIGGSLATPAEFDPASESVALMTTLKWRSRSSLVTCDDSQLSFCSEILNLDLPGGKVRARPELRLFVEQLLLDTDEWSTVFKDKRRPLATPRRAHAVIPCAQNTPHAHPQSCGKGAFRRHRSYLVSSSPRPAKATYALEWHSRCAFDKIGALEVLCPQVAAS